MLKKIPPYILFILLSLGVGAFSAFLTADNMNIYSDIVRPPLSPPGIVFPIVWTILYVLMGIGAGLVYSQKNEQPLNVRSAMIIFGLNLFFNFMWSILFFNLRAYLFSFVWLVALWFIIFNMIQRFKEVNTTAGNLQIPYLIWVTFAGYLNLAIYFLN